MHVLKASFGASPCSIRCAKKRRKHPQRAARVAQRGPFDSRTIRGDDAAQYERRQTRNITHSNPIDMRGKLPQIELIIVYRGGAKSHRALLSMLPDTTSRSSQIVETAQPQCVGSIENRFFPRAGRNRHGSWHRWTSMEPPLRCILLTVALRPRQRLPQGLCCPSWIAGTCRARRSIHRRGPRSIQNRSSSATRLHSRCPRVPRTG
jgi:hypothetical protein